MNTLPTFASAREPHMPPQGFSLRQSAGAFDDGVSIQKAPEDWRSPRRWRAVAGLCILALLFAAASCPAEDFYADDQDSLKKAIDDAAGSADVENFINLDRISINLTDTVVIDTGFGPERRLTIRPRPGLSSRAQLRSINAAATIVSINDVGYITLQDLDLLRATYNRASLLALDSVTNVVVERCRVGSVSTSGGQAGHANIYLHNPVRTVVRNTICFAHLPGTFDKGIVLFQQSAMNSGLWLYNNLVADHRLYGIELTAGGDSTLHLRNNVVVNHPSAIVPEPTAYRSILDNLVTVYSSHNMAFASAVMSNIEQQDGPQNISNFDHADFFQRNRQAAALAFVQTRWTTQPAANPNWNLFRLRNDGPLHESGSVTGLTIGDDDPDEFDIAVTDDIEKDARPSNHGGISHTDRGPDQFRSLTAGDITVDLRPRLPGLDPIRLSGGGFEVVAVGPQSDFPVVETVMRSGNYTGGGRLSGIAGMSLALPRPVALAIGLARGNNELKFAWPLWAEGFSVEEAAAVGGGTPDPGANWKPVMQTPMVEQENFTIRVTPMTTGNRFYRLRKSD